jgi:hypothetical protein
MRRVVGDRLTTALPIAMSVDHADLESKLLCAICERPGLDSDIFQQLCCERFVAHVACVLDKKNANKTIRCQTCMVAEMGRRPVRRRRLTLWGYFSIGFPILIMMLISSYLLPPLIGQWWFKVPYSKLPLRFFSIDTGLMFFLEGGAALGIWASCACCFCSCRGLFNACCCCCHRCCGEDEPELKIQ